MKRCFACFILLLILGIQIPSSVMIYSFIDAVTYFASLVIQQFGIIFFFNIATVTISPTFKENYFFLHSQLLERWTAVADLYLLSFQCRVISTTQIVYITSYCNLQSYSWSIFDPSHYFALARQEIRLQKYSCITLCSTCSLLSSLFFIFIYSICLQ